jgi:hypothetical protein
VKPNMPVKVLAPFLSVLFLGVLALGHPQFGIAEERAKPLDANDSRLNFSFAPHAGDKPLHLKVKLNKKGAITGVSVFREGEPYPLQTLHGCNDFPDEVDTNWQDDEISKLVVHGDLNFDGFEDLELLQNYVPHLDKKLYCIFLWNSTAGQFVYSKELTEIATNLEPHPESKTLRVREDWLGGPWQGSTYRWNEGKLELIEQTSLLGDWSQQTDKVCGFTFSCSRRIRGNMAETLTRPICKPEEMVDLPTCPAAGSDLKLDASKPTQTRTTLTRTTLTKGR